MYECFGAGSSKHSLTYSIYLMDIWLLMRWVDLESRSCSFIFKSCRGSSNILICCSLYHLNLNPPSPKTKYHIKRSQLACLSSWLSCVRSGIDVSTILLGWWPCSWLPHGYENLNGHGLHSSLAQDTQDGKKAMQRKSWARRFQQMSKSRKNPPVSWSLYIKRINKSTLVNEIVLVRTKSESRYYWYTKKLVHW